MKTDSFEFTPDGEFIKYLFRPDQDPGEFNGDEDYLPADNQIIIRQRSPNKIFILDRLGNLIKEFKLQEARACHKVPLQDKYLMVKHAFSQIDKIMK